MFVSQDVKYVGVNDHNIDLFEGQYKVPNGMAYNSYVILDDKVAVLDTVDKNFVHQWLDNLQNALGSRKPDYLIVQHMEPDHSSCIVKFMETYPSATVVASEKAFKFMANFYKKDYEDRRVISKDGNALDLGKHKLVFLAAPMVHWPEVMLTYDSTDKILYSADAFGKFGANDAEEPWEDEGRRYYIGIVGKYGVQVQNVLKTASSMDIKVICPLHGPVLSENLSYYLEKYNTWSSYAPETEGVLIAYTSVYGNTKQAVELLKNKLDSNGCPNVVVRDLARSDMSSVVAEAFKYSKTVLATTTYNSEIFPFMSTFIHALTERGFKNRTVGIIENGSWAPSAERVIKSMFESSKNISFCESTVHILSSLSDENKDQIEALSTQLFRPSNNDKKSAVKNDLTALFKIGYGLYVVTSNDGTKDNGLIVNTVSQVTNSPNRVAVCINKQNYSHHVIKQTSILNVNCLSVEAPFSVFKHFGMQSGRTVDKFASASVSRSSNGLVVLPEYINAFMSLKVEQYVDLDTHGMFICQVTEADVISNKETMTYNYYQSNVKPKPETKTKKGWVCKICGYVHESEELPPDFVCPLCKHGASDFEKIQ